MSNEFQRKQRIVVIGGGPGGYDAALAAAQLGADVTLIERSGVGGSAVMTDVVPSKSLIATAEAVLAVNDAESLGVQIFINDESGSPRKPQVAVNLAAINKRLLKMATDMCHAIDQLHVTIASKSRFIPCKTITL